MDKPDTVEIEVEAELLLTECLAVLNCLSSELLVDKELVIELINKINSFFGPDNQEYGQNFQP